MFAADGLHILGTNAIAFQLIGAVATNGIVRYAGHQISLTAKLDDTRCNVR
jgi:hypothetical protein